MEENFLKKEQNNKFKEIVSYYYESILEDFKQNDFQITPPEAIFIRKTIENIIIEDNEISEIEKKTGKFTLEYISNVYLETLERFFWNYYEVRYTEYIKGINELNDEKKKKIKKDFFEYIKNIRNNRELI